MARPGNSNLHDSSRNKQDEFYTNLQLIEDELDWYRPHFMGKRVLCNCDDPYESNFFKYFAMNFNALGLKSLTATCYATSPVVYTQLDLFGGGDKIARKERKGTQRGKPPYKIVITEVKDENGDGRISGTNAKLRNMPESSKRFAAAFPTSSQSPVTSARLRVRP